MCLTEIEIEETIKNVLTNFTEKKLKQKRKEVEKRTDSVCKKIKHSYIYGNSEFMKNEIISFSIGRSFDSFMGSAYEQIYKILTFKNGHKKLPSDFKPKHPITGRNICYDIGFIHKETSECIIKEIKLGGNLDTKKIKQEKSSLLEVKKQYEETYKKSCKISLGIFYITSNNKHDFLKDQAIILTEFNENQIEVEKEFWEDVCGEGSFEIIKKCIIKYQYILENYLKEVKKLYILI